MKLVHLPSHTVLLELDNNDRVTDVVRETALPQHMFMSVRLPSEDGTEVTARLKILLPPGYKDTDRISFPILFQV